MRQLRSARPFAPPPSIVGSGAARPLATPRGAGRRVRRLAAACCGVMWWCAASAGLVAQNPESAPASRPLPFAATDSRAAESRAAERPAPRDVSADLAAILARRGAPGLVALRIDGRRVTAAGAAGVRRRGDPTPITLDDPFHLGSCTKAMTAVLCAKLVEEGRLRFDSTLGETLGAEAGPEGGPWRAPRLVDLLRHSAGVPGDLSPRGVWGRLWTFEGTPRDARKLLLRELVAGPPPAGPSPPVAYSNASFALAGLMAETAADVAYETLLREKVFAPLGMTGAGFGAPGRAAAGPPDAPRGHRADGAPVEPGRDADNPEAITPAGRVHAPIASWGRFVADLLAGARGERALLAPAVYARVFEGGGSDRRGEAGLGVFRADRPWAGGPAYTHSGSNTFWFCAFWLAPARDFAVLAACNAGGDAGAKAVDDACAFLLGPTPSPR